MPVAEPPLRSRRVTEPPARRRRDRLLHGGGLFLNVLVTAFAIVALLGFALALSTTTVEGDSMGPTLRDGDVLLADHITTLFRGPHDGEVVVASPPIRGDVVKRVVAGPGDVVEIDPAYTADGHTGPAVLLGIAGGPLKPLAEPYVKPGWSVNAACCDARGRATADSRPHPVTLGADQYLLLGDNRNVSSDSRAYGFLGRAQIHAIVRLRYLPLSAFGGFGAATPLGAFVLVWPPAARPSPPRRRGGVLGVRLRRPPLSSRSRSASRDWSAG